MKQTIYYLSDIKWKRETLFAHIKYAERSKDFRGFFGDKEEVIKAASMAMSKRKNALAGFSCVLAVPNDLDMDGIANVANKVKSIFSNLLDTDYILIYYHDSTSIVNNKNKHFHIIVANLNRQGKSLRVNKNMLKQLHSELQACLNDMGYEIRKEEPGIQIKHLGYRLLKDEKIKEEYMNYLESKKHYMKEFNHIKEEVIDYGRQLRELEDEIRSSITKAEHVRAKCDTTRATAEHIAKEYTTVRNDIKAETASNLRNRAEIRTQTEIDVRARRELQQTISELQSLAHRIQQFDRQSQDNKSILAEISRFISSILRDNHESVEGLLPRDIESIEDINLKSQDIDLPNIDVDFYSKELNTIKSAILKTKNQTSSLESDIKQIELMTSFSNAINKLDNLTKTIKQKQKLKEQTKPEDKDIKLKDEVAILLNYYNEVIAYGEDDEYFIRTSLEINFNKEDVILALSYIKSISKEEASTYVENIIKHHKEQHNKEIPNPETDII